MSKSFKDIYNEDKVVDLTKVEKPTPPPSRVFKEHSTKEVLPEVTNTPTMPQAKSPKVEQDDKVMEALKEQRAESEKLVETLVKSNKKMSVTVAKLVESANETNSKLLEAITALTDKVSLLEHKIEQMKDIEIPTPVVNLQMPGRRTTKTVHRDPKGYITHIEEAESFEDAEDEDGIDK